MESDFAKVTGEQSQKLITCLLPYLQQMQSLLPLLGQHLISEKQSILLANATCFMNIFGQAVMSWLWIRQASVAENALIDIGLTEEDKAFYLGKVQAAKYFVHWELPAVQRDIALLNDMDDSCSEMRAEWF
jgi:hypothetical protein